MTLVIAHRGASAYAPENTMPAFELAVRQGADMLELDVQRSADGVLVIFHDDTTERWDGRRRLASSCTLAELLALDIGGAQVTTLAEVCAFARERGVRLNVELKAAGFGVSVARMLRDAQIEELVLISSFVETALLEFAAASPHIPRAYLMGTESYRPDVRLREAWPFGALRRTGARAWHPAAQLPLLDWLSLSLMYDLFARNSLLPDAMGGSSSGWGVASDLSVGLRLSITRSVQAFSF